MRQTVKAIPSDRTRVASPASDESSNFAAQIKDVAIERGDFLNPAEVKNYNNIFRQVKRGIVPESVREVHRERDLARSQVVSTRRATSHKLPSENRAMR